MYNELLEYEIIPAIERESLEELSVHEMGEIVEKLDEKVKEYKKLNIDFEPVFEFLEANMSFSRFSVRGKSNVENELGFELMAVYLRMYITINNKDDNNTMVNGSEKRTASNFSLIQSAFSSKRLSFAQPL